MSRLSEPFTLYFTLYDEPCVRLLSPYSPLEESPRGHRSMLHKASGLDTELHEKPLGDLGLF